MKVTIHIMPKNGVLDPQGKAIEHALDGLGFEGVSSARQGKIIELELDESLKESDIKKMCEDLLANPVVEDYKIQIAQ